MPPSLPSVDFGFSLCRKTKNKRKSMVDLAKKPYKYRYIALDRPEGALRNTSEGEKYED
ncbi:hypothetical protein PDESU_03070 [Pontiella desulfatans]|uniref:Uncharacterized protein n=1 Tax=Pontiella desulfatans TaxID=2750659 RepID=A0A6C2U3B7_PONDE|nr:hypothetical protein PDESU_03070 [Pontiella desulfatans]